MSADAKWNKAQKLAVAGAIAPSLRSVVDKTAKRKVTLVNEDGKVTGYTTLAKVQESLLKTREIELEVQEGVRPKEIICQGCGRPVKVKKNNGPLPKYCYGECRMFSCDLCGKKLDRGNCLRKSVKARGAPRCAECYLTEQTVPRLSCVDCGKTLCKQASHPNNPGRKAGLPPRCVRCSRHALLPMLHCVLCKKELSRMARRNALKAQEEGTTNPRAGYCASCYTEKCRKEGGKNRKRDAARRARA